MNEFALVVNFDNRPVLRINKNSIKRALTHERVDFVNELDETHRYWYVSSVVTRLEDEISTQTIASEENFARVVVNCRLDNRTELAAMLDISPLHCTDAQILLAAYRRWDKAFVKRIVGEYAFAIWDERRQTLICGRDLMGRRIIYYWRQGHQLIVATQISPFLQIRHIPNKMNLEKVAGFVTSLSYQANSTFFEEVHVVPAASTMCASETTSRIEVSDSLTPDIDIARLSEHEQSEKFLHSYKTAVERCIKSKGAVGALLSGGLDSSSMVALAAGLLERDNRRIAAIGAVPETSVGSQLPGGYDYDEREYMRLMQLEYKNVDLNLMPNREFGFFTGLGQFFADTGTPVWTPFNSMWPLAAYSRFSHDEVKTVLSAHFGNMSISYSGHTVYYELFRQGSWRKLMSEISIYKSKKNVGGLWAFKNLVLARCMPLFGWRILDYIRNDNRQVSNSTAIRPEFLRTTGVIEALRQRGWDPKFRYPSRGLERRLAYFESAGPVYGVIDNALSFRFGLRIQEPTIDRDLLELCLGLPDEAHLRDGIDRRSIRAWMADYVPEKIRNRTTFGMQSSDWFLELKSNQQKLKGVLSDMDSSPLVREVFDVSLLKKEFNSIPETTDCSLALIGRFKESFCRSIMLGLFLLWAENNDYQFPE